VFDIDSCAMQREMDYVHRGMMVRTLTSWLCGRFPHMSVSCGFKERKTHAMMFFSSPEIIFDDHLENAVLASVL
jgi:hypothetical protein